MVMWHLPAPGPRARARALTSLVCLAALPKPFVLPGAALATFGAELRERFDTFSELQVEMGSLVDSIEARTVDDLKKQFADFSEQLTEEMCARAKARFCEGGDDCKHFCEADPLKPGESCDVDRGAGGSSWCADLFEQQSFVMEADIDKTLKEVDEEHSYMKTGWRGLSERVSILEEQLRKKAEKDAEKDESKEMVDGMPSWMPDLIASSRIEANRSLEVFKQKMVGIIEAERDLTRQFLNKVKKDVEYESNCCDSAGRVTREVDLVELRNHSIPTDCWTIINGDVVVDVTPMLDQPFGRIALRHYCGEDATDAWNNIFFIYWTGMPKSRKRGRFKPIVSAPPADTEAAMATMLAEGEGESLAAAPQQSSSTAATPATDAPVSRHAPAAPPAGTDARREDVAADAGARAASLIRRTEAEGLAVAR